MMVGLCGVGKTVLLDQMRRDAESDGIQTVRIEAPEGRSLPAPLALALRLALLHLSKKEAAKEYAIRGLRALAGFVSKLKVTFNDIEVGSDYEPEPGLADNGDLEIDLATLLEQVGCAAKAADTAVVLFIDELRYVKRTADGGPDFGYSPLRSGTAARHSGRCGSASVARTHGRS